MKTTVKQPSQRASDVVRIGAAVAVRPGKHPTSRLAGPYGHPFHPMLVAIPIGAWTLALVFDIVMWIRDSTSTALFEASYWAIAIGIAGAAVAAVPGVLD